MESVRRHNIKYGGILMKYCTLKENAVFAGFKLLHIQDIKELNSRGFEFIHQKSGARLFFLENDDDNKVFSISFRTPPKDDTGVAHIVEHSVLCGSRKYPLKEPFVELVKGSLNTFLNAMTFPDKTMYPVASRNDKDFQNLMDVYLDAVLYPSLYDVKETLLQEGWHYEIDNIDDELKYSGVVYNEMKGATSSPEDLLGTKLLQHLYPNTPYAFESGGNPENITDLTQEMFEDFHKKYYHPANSYIYLYGDLDIEEKLKFLDRQYLSAFEKINVQSEISEQLAFNELQKHTEEYPVRSDEDTKDKTFLTFATMVDDHTSSELALDFLILHHTLFVSEAAPIRQAILNANIGKDVYAEYEQSLRQGYLSVTLVGSEEEKGDKFLDILKDICRKLVREGLDKKLLKATLSILEFRLREANFGQTPKGLVYGINLMNSWLYDQSPMTYLYYEEAIEKAREKIETNYFENLISEIFLENPHQILLTLKPSKTLAKEREEKNARLLKAKKEKFSQFEIENLIQINQNLKRRQARADLPENLAKIPLLELSDIKKEVDLLKAEENKIGDNTVLLTDIETQGISYLNLYFDISKVELEQVLYAQLCIDLLALVDTEDYSYQELATKIALYTGGISGKITAFSEYQKPTSCLPKLKLHAKAFTRNLPQLFDILTAILTKSKFNDEKRLETLIRQIYANIELDILRSPQNFLLARISSYLTPAGNYNEQKNLAYFRFLKEILLNFTASFPKIQSNLEHILPLLVNRENLLIGVTMSEKDYEAFEKSTFNFLSKLPQKKLEARYDIAPFKTKNEGMTTSSRVQYVAKGANFINKGFSFTGTMDVLSTIMRYEYLWTKIRVQGGAYGAGATFTNDGKLIFFSYRDPNLKETLKVFDETASYLRDFDVSTREMKKYIIGTISMMDLPKTPEMQGNLAVEAWITHLTNEKRQQRRDEVLSTTIDDIRRLADVVDACMKDNIYCVLGNENKVQQEKDLFTSIISLID